MKAFFTTDFKGVGEDTFKNHIFFDFNRRNNSFCCF